MGNLLVDAVQCCRDWSLLLGEIGRLFVAYGGVNLCAEYPILRSEQQSADISVDL